MIKGRWIIGSVAVGLIGIHVGPLLFTHSEQDACSFGNVTNEEYRSILARASLGTWRPLMRSDGEATRLLNRKYHELLPNPPNTTMKIVVAHAVLRALGAEFRRFDDDKSQIADAKVRRMFRYQYVLDINRLFYFAPVLRTMWIVVLVENPLQTPLTRDAPSDLRITAYFPNLVDGVPHVDREELACPPIPQI